MARDQNRHGEGNERDLTTNRAEQQSSVPNDLPDNPHDRERLRPEETTINLPDVSDIPGQEFVRGRPMGEMSDMTISSEDEEGDRVFGNRNEDEDVEYVMGTEADVSKNERRTLEDTEYLPTRDEDNLRDARMDNVDFQGESLNEGGFGPATSGTDLDMPIVDQDDRNEAIGEEDEENNTYSLGSADNDNVTEGTP